MISRRLAELYFPYSRHHYWYVRFKAGMDPLYDIVHEELGDSSKPLLDVGCGMGLLSFHLALRGRETASLGVDYDEGKIRVAQAVASEHFLTKPIRFQTARVDESLPDHVGDVTLLDVLQYLPVEAQGRLLRACAGRVAPGGRLILRSGLRDDSWRFRVTSAADFLANKIRWMKGPPQIYPDRDFLLSHLLAAGLAGDLRPLRGKTPFNNWLGVFHKTES